MEHIGANTLILLPPIRILIVDDFDPFQFQCDCDKTTEKKKDIKWKRNQKKLVLGLLKGFIISKMTGHKNDHFPTTFIYDAHFQAEMS